jgi:hypothetical protein
MRDFEIAAQNRAVWNLTTMLVSQPQRSPPHFKLCILPAVAFSDCR